MKRETIQRVATPTAILVGLPDPLAELCTDVLGEGGLRVLRVGHCAAAAERIPVVMAQIVVVSSTTAAADLEMLNDRCVAVGAQMLQFATTTDRAELVRTLRDAASTALIRALRG